MKLTILGNNGPYPSAGGACSGYLIEHEDTKILLDCGNGVLSNLLKVCEVEQLDAIILSHLHPDHISDLFVFRYALWPKGKKIPVYAPSSPIEEFERLHYDKAYEMYPIEEHLQMNIGSLSISFSELKHLLQNYGICIEVEGKKFIYTGDTQYDEKVIDFAKDADMLLIECGVLERDLESNTPHLSAKQACKIGKESKAKKLLLTHFHPKYRVDEYIIETINQYDGLLVMTQLMQSYKL